MILHRKRILTNRPDDPAQAAKTRGISNWDDDHNAPPFLAYAFSMVSPVQAFMANRNMSDTEIPKLRGRYDFTYVKSVRVTVGVDYGSAIIFPKYSRDGSTWKSFDNAGAPFITETQGGASPAFYASGWVDLVDDAKADALVAPFFRANQDTQMIQIYSMFLYVR